MDLIFTMLVPFLMLAVALWGLVKRVDLWGALTDGAEKGMKVSLRIMPPLIGLLTAVYMLRASGALELLGEAVGPLLSAVGIPSETIGLLLVRPISGNAALGVGSELMATYGVDSTIGRTAAVMLGCSETTFYTVAVYSGAARVGRSRYAIPAALCADIAGFLAAAWSVRVIFGQG